MRKSNKKGFTVVELVIVIAIIAILAAVLIPTFASLIQKANESKDTQLVKNLNTALAADNKEHKTMTDALDAAAAFGYDVGKINASATGNEILWDSKNDVFCYLKNGNVEYIPETNLKNGAVAANETYMLWKIYNEAPTAQTYSIYWNSDADFTAPLTVGFDTGNNTAITALKYERPTGDKQEVVIRTNGGSLTINAPLDTVSHYSIINVVDINDVAPTDCYHEYGTVKGTLNLAKGKVILENGSNTGFVNVTANSANDIAIEIKDNAEYGRVTATNETLLNAVKDKITSTDEVKTLVAAEGTVAIVNGVAYNTLDAAIAAFTGENAVFELFCDVANYDMDHKKSIMMPANATFNGHGYKFIGNVAIYLNSQGGKVTNVSFYLIANNVAIDEETREYYKMDKVSGELTAIYANELTGKLAIENCIFDSITWDAIQITPKAGAEIVIHNNVFKTSNTVINQQMRYIHVESSPYTDFTISVKNCDFYDLSKLNQTGLEIYYPTVASKVVFAGNYYDGLDTSKTYTNDDCKQGGTLFSGHFACVGTGGSSYSNAGIRVLDEVASKPNN